MPTEDAEYLAQAEKLLREAGSAAGDFNWLLGGTQFWGAKEVSDHLKDLGIGGEKGTVLRWFKASPHRDFGGLGLRMTRDDLIIMLAEQLFGLNKQQMQQDA